jgi:multidrug efflux pump subunit AcrA (membrane-fusion protein)
MRHVQKHHRPNRPEYASEEVREIVGAVPHWMLRWGTAILLVILLVCIAASAFIPYPVIVSASFRLTTRQAPKAILARTDGRLSSLLVVENQQVRKNELLGYLESTADPSQVLALETYLDSLSGAMAPEKIEYVRALSQPALGHLGELQLAYQIFTQSYADLLAVLSDGYHLNKKALLTEEHQQLKNLGKNLQEQRSIASRDFALARQEYGAQQTLARDQVIAAMDLTREESKLLARQMHLKQVESLLIQNRAEQSAKRQAILELDNQISQQQSSFRQALNTLRSEIHAWEQRYVLRAPFEGQVYFGSLVEENQYFERNQSVCFVAPARDTFLGELSIPQYNLGKVKTNQRVLIKFASYPFEEFGWVEGRISAIAEIPSTDGTFSASVSLPQGLTTTSGKRIGYKTDILATGEIITDDTTILERIFYRLRKVVQ